MRILLIFIVILNLLYAGWEYVNPARKMDYVPPLPDNLMTLELLHEERAQALKKSVEEAGVVVEVKSSPLEQDELLVAEVLEIKKDGPVSCYTLGPFKDESIMQQLRESIAEYVTDISVRKRQESEKHRYWVYIPALSSRKQAKLVAKQLRLKKINDFYIVLSGDSKNSISLGHYREPVHANRRVKIVTDLGLKAEIKIIYRDYDVYWLDYQVEEADGEAGFSVDEYVSDGVSQLGRECSN